MHFALANAQEIRHELGCRLRSQRLIQSLPQDELALRAGISLSALKRLEKNGAATLESLLKVALALGLANDFQSLFAPNLTSIAQMEQAEQAQRKRAPRRSAKPH